MMNGEQYLLLKLAEEATEVAQMASKCMQFGLPEVREGWVATNAERLYGELNDLVAAIQMLNTHSRHFQFEPNQAAVEDKIKKVQKYHKISKELGKVR